MIKNEAQSLLHQVNELTKRFKKGIHYTVDENQRNVALTNAGIQAVEEAFGCGNLFDDLN